MYSNFKYNNNRIGFVAPFLFGALAGGATASYFNPYRPRPYYYVNSYYPYYW